MKKVFVSGCYDLLHSGHVEFFRQAAQYGDLYVGIGSDQTILHYKKHRTLYPEQERLFMVKAIRYVKDAFINDGDGVMDFIGTVDRIKPDIFVVNADGASEAKRQFCAERGIEYVVLQRTPSVARLKPAFTAPHLLQTSSHPMIEQPVALGPSATSASFLAGVCFTLVVTVTFFPASMLSRASFAS